MVMAMKKHIINKPQHIMKGKNFIFAALILGAGFCVIISQNRNKQETSKLVMSSVEVLSVPEAGQNNPNGGPREKEKCFKGGHKMVCLSVNNVDCTDSDCF